MIVRIAVYLTAVTLIAVLPVRAAAQHDTGTAYPYIAIDVGTLGGPLSGFNTPGVILTNQGAVVGWSDTAISDTDYLNYNPTVGQDPFVEHAFVWTQGILRDLGALPGNNSSGEFVVNAHGDAVGYSENGALDPLEGYPEVRAVLWRNGHVINLGTLGGNESIAGSLNNRSQVVGWATNTISDSWILQPFPLTWGTQMHAVLWQDGVMRDLGTLGGPDSMAMYVNEYGQIAGASFTNTISQTVTGRPTEDPFLWTDGHMRDLGTLGGTVGFPSGGPSSGLNDRGKAPPAAGGRHPMPSPPEAMFTAAGGSPSPTNPRDST